MLHAAWSLSGRVVAKLNPPRGNKRPTKNSTKQANGRFSSKQVHHLLQKLSTEFEEFLAEHEGESDSDDMQTEEGQE